MGGPCAAPDTAKGPQLSDVGENPTHGGLHIRVMMEASALRKTLVLVCLVFVACFLKTMRFHGPEIIGGQEMLRVRHSI